MAQLSRVTDAVGPDQNDDRGRGTRCDGSNSAVPVLLTVPVLLNLVTTI